MSDAYRSAEKRAPLVLAARARAVTPLLALALVVATFAVIFAARASATLSCKRDPEHKERTTCFVDDASVARPGWSRNYERELVDAWGVMLDRRDGVAHLIVATRDGRVDLLQSTASDDELRPFVHLVEDVAVDHRSDYDFRSTRRWIVDLRLVTPAIVFVVFALALSVRRRRLVLDRERGELSLTTYFGLLPWHRQRLSLAHTVRARVERDQGHTRLLLVREQRAPDVVLDEEGSAPELDELAQKITAACDAAV